MSYCRHCGVFALAKSSTTPAANKIADDAASTRYAATRLASATQQGTMDPINPAVPLKWFNHKLDMNCHKIVECCYRLDKQQRHIKQTDTEGKVDAEHAHNPNTTPNHARYIVLCLPFCNILIFFAFRGAAP